MFRYIIRRLSLMLVNLAAVSVLVFLLGRLLPDGRVPEERSTDQLAAASDPALRRWYEQRYGIDQPLHAQFLRWWRSMFTAQRDVLWWTDERPARALYQTERSNDAPQLFAKDDNGQWHLFRPVNLNEQNVELLRWDERGALRRLSSLDRAMVQRLVVRGQPPMHHFVAGTFDRRADDHEMQSMERSATTTTLYQVTLGWSRATDETVAEAFSRRLPVTALIGGLSVALLYTVAVPLGIISAARRGGWFDRMVHGATLVLWSLPMVLVATVLLGWLASQLGMFPLGGASSVDSATMPFGRWLADRLWHVALPVVVLSAPGIAYVTRQVRSAVLEQLDADYMRTALAKGLSYRAAIMRHALRPAMIVVATLLATVLPMVIGGSVIVESLFGIDGMGRLVYRAVLNGDYDVVQAFALVAAAANMLGILIADVVCALIDPRVCYTQGEVLR